MLRASGDRWTASTTGSVRKGFEFGMYSSMASAAEVKGSGRAEQGRTRQKGEDGRQEEEEEEEEEAQRDGAEEGE